MSDVHRLSCRFIGLDFALPRLRALSVLAVVFLFSVVLTSPSARAGGTTPAQQLGFWSAQAGAPAHADRGEVFFTSKHGGEWSCSSCHGTPPTGQGQHASTGKRINPLAPAFNPQSLTDTARTDKWFRRNCKDVLSRECTAAEKADVLAYLISLQR